MAECPIVQTLHGKVKGKACLKAKPKESKQVFRYAGIPYGKPPVGDLRFEPPQRCDSWDGVKETFNAAPLPMQPLQISEYWLERMPCLNEFNEEWRQTDEDCLYLDVYTTNPDERANMPVLFWIYGGGFQIGGTMFYSAQVLCGLHDVVVVAVNYRLNIFGFLTTGKDTDYPGNMGMLDQVMGLEWTRDNIRNFGGNPDNVTIFGESAGAMSVSAHMFSPMSRALFHKAIHHSGTANSPGYLKSDCSSVLNNLKQKLSITDSDANAIVTKLKSTSSKDLVEIAKENMQIQDSFSLTVDGRFLLDHPASLLEKGEISRIPSIIGCNNSECSGLMTGNHPTCFSEGYTEEEFDTHVKILFEPYFIEKGQEASNKWFEKIKSHYGKQFSDDDKLKWTKVAAAAHGDFLFAIPTIHQAQVSSKNENPIYLYYMTQQLKCHHLDEYAVEIKKKSDLCECDHADDITFTFGVPLMNGKKLKECKFDADEEQLSRVWMTYIANFAASGNPNVGKNVEHSWPVYEAETHRHLVVKIPLTESSHLKHGDYDMWNNMLPTISKFV